MIQVKCTLFSSGSINMHLPMKSLPQKCLSTSSQKVMAKTIPEQLPLHPPIIWVRPSSHLPFHLQPSPCPSPSSPALLAHFLHLWVRLYCNYLPVSFLHSDKLCELTRPSCQVDKPIWTINISFQ